LQVQKGGNQNLANVAKKAFGNATNFGWFHSFKKRVQVTAFWVPLTSQNKDLIPAAEMHDLV
jgi:hypothetical protein